MNNYIIRCPCCDNEFEIKINSSGCATAFLLSQTHISQAELINKYNIELGIVESEVDK